LFWESYIFSILDFAFGLFCFGELMI